LHPVRLSVHPTRASDFLKTGKPGEFQQISGLKVKVTGNKMYKSLFCTHVPQKMDRKSNQDQNEHRPILHISSSSNTFQKQLTDCHMPIVRSIMKCVESLYFGGSYPLRQWMVL